MKLYVLSDTHGKIDKALHIYDRLCDVDLIVHLGDMEKDAARISEHMGRDVVSVKGNNDGSYSMDDFKILETEYGKLLLTHGHLQNVKYDLQRLLYRTCELGCKAVLFGHTHVPLFMESNGIYLVNPGSLTYPAAGEQGSYAIVNTYSTGFSASVVYYSDIFSF